MGVSSPLRGKNLWLLGAAGLALAIAVSGQSVDSRGAGRERCTSDVELPLTVRVVPVETPHPGASLRVRVEIESMRDFDDATVRVVAPPDVPVAEGRSADLGPLSAHSPRQHEFTVVVPAGGARRTVDVKVRAVMDGGPVFELGATLNLSFEEEASRVVTDLDGTKVREVLARKIP